MRDFRELIESDGIYVFDGAMGTRLYEKGIYINRSYDELNLIKFPKARSMGLVKPGEWNHVKLTVIGDKATMEINGQAAWETDGLEARDGYLGIQVEVPGGGQFEFKEITVTELGYKPLFDGTSLAGCTSTTLPAVSGTPSTSTSEKKVAICRGGKLTTPNTRRPMSSSRE